MEANAVRTKQFDRLYNDVINSSAKNRNLFVFYILFIVYVLVIVFSTRDLDLLLPNSSINLPLLSLDMPLRYFYALVPLFVLAFQFNLLHNAAEHIRKIADWKTLCGNDFQENQIQPFLLDFAFLKNTDDGLVRFLTETLYLVSAPLTLLCVQIRFAAFQSPAFTAWHLLMVWLSLGFVAWYGYHRTAWLAKLGKPGQPVTRFGKRLLFYGLFPVLSFGVWEVQRILYYTPLALASYQNLYLFPKISIDPNTRIFNIREEDLYLAKIHNQSVTDQEAWQKFGIGLDLRGRSLKYANLASAILYKANLEDAQLQGADLRYAQLRGAVLFRAQLNEAFLGDAQLQGADLTLAYLQRAVLNSAKLQEAVLTSAKLQEASLEDAELQGADLSTAEMQGAGPYRAHLQKANLRGAQLQGASLDEAQLQGANLEGAELQGASLNEAQLQGANLEEAELQGASLKEAQLQGAFLKLARLEGADVYSAQFQGTNLSAAKLQGVPIYSAELQGVETEWIFPDDTTGLIANDFLKKILQQQGKVGELKDVEQGILSEEQKQNLIAELEQIPINPSIYRHEYQIKTAIGRIQRSRSAVELSDDELNNLGAYTKEEAEQWIAEYERAMASVPKKE